MNINSTRNGGLYELNDSGPEFSFYNSDEAYKLDTLTFIPFSKFERIYREKSPHKNIFSLGFRLSAQGTKEFEEMTSRNIGKQVCFVVDGQVMAAPTVHSTIPNGQVSLSLGDEKAVELIIDYLGN